MYCGLGLVFKGLTVVLDGVEAAETVMVDAAARF